MKQIGKWLLTGVVVLTAQLLTMSGCVSQRADEAAVQPRRPRSLLVLGDSIADGYMDVDTGGQAVARECCYGTRLQQALGLDEAHYDNQAVSGWTTGDLLAHIDDVTASLPDPDMVAISIGGNDILHPLTHNPELLADLYGVIQSMGGNTGASLEDRLRTALANQLAEIADRPVYTQALQTAQENLGAILDELSRRFPDAVLVVQTLYNPLDKGGEDSLSLPGVDRLNDIIRQTAAGRERVQVLEVGEAFAGQAGRYISADYIHPNREGHAAIAALYQALWEPAKTTVTALS